MEQNVADYGIQAFGERVIVKPEDRKTHTAAGLQIPDNMTEKPMKGLVVSSGVKEITVGTYIIYGRYCGAKIKASDDKTDLVVLNVEDVLAVMKK